MRDFAKTICLFMISDLSDISLRFYFIIIIINIYKYIYIYMVNHMIYRKSDGRYDIISVYVVH